MENYVLCKHFKTNDISRKNEIVLKCKRKLFGIFKRFSLKDSYMYKDFFYILYSIYVFLLICFI